MGRSLVHHRQSRNHRSYSKPMMYADISFVFLPLLIFLIVYMVMNDER